MKDIKVFYTCIKEDFPEDLYVCYLDYLPNQIQQKNKNLVRWQDKQLHLFGKILLINGLRQYGYMHHELRYLQYNKYGRPFLNHKLDFNISHSGDYVVCAIGQHLRLGIDIEKIHEIDFNDFKGVFDNEQWNLIYTSEKPLEEFFKYWTIKESVIKADSRGLSISLKNIVETNHTVKLDGNIWYLNELHFADNYKSYLATNSRNPNIKYKYVDLYEITPF